MRRSLFCVWVLVVSAGCGDDDGGGSGPRPALVVTTSDFMTGGLGVIDEDGQVGVAAGMNDDQDTIPVRLDDRVALLERGNGLMKLQSTGDPLLTEREINLNPGGMSGFYLANPQAAVAVAADRAYVTRLASNAIAVVDTAGAAVTGEIDLGPLAGAMDTDMLVDASDLAQVGSRVFVALGRYWFDAMYAIHFDDGSVLAVIDAETDTLADADDAVTGVQGVELMGDNPTRIVHDAAGNRLLVHVHGDFAMLDGGIEAVDLGSLESSGIILDESTVGAEINAFVLVDAGSGWVIAGDRVRSWDVAAGTVGEPLSVPGAAALELDGETLWVASRAMEGAGIYALRASDGAALMPYSAPMTVGELPPYGIAAVP